jgi:alpha/beta superfamily hydrolase
MKMEVDIALDFVQTRMPHTQPARLHLFGDSFGGVVVQWFRRI